MHSLKRLAIQFLEGVFRQAKHTSVTAAYSDHVKNVDPTTVQIKLPWLIADANESDDDRAVAYLELALMYCQ